MATLTDLTGAIQPYDGSNVINSFLMGRKLAKESQEEEKQNRLSEILNNTPKEGRADTLYKLGMFKEAQDYEKNQADIGKTNAESQLKEFEHKSKMLDASLNLTNAFANDPMLNKQKMQSELDLLAKTGVIDANTYQQSISHIAELPDDTISLRNWAQQTQRRLMGAKESMQYQMPDANAMLSAQTSQANAQLSADTQRRGQDMSAETQRSGQQVNYDLGMQRLQNDRQKTNLTGLKQPAIPAAIQSAYVGNKAALDKINNAFAVVGKNPDAFGLKNMAGDTIMQRLDEGGVDARALISDIASLKIHDRSGAAVTAAEMPRLKPFIPNVTDTPETIKKKLTNFRQEYEQINREYEQLHPGLSGANNGRGASDSWGASQAPQGVDPAEWQQFLQEMGP